MSTAAFYRQKHILPDKVFSSRDEKNRHITAISTINKDYICALFTLANEASLCYNIKVIFPGVAQIGSALEWGSRGRRFDSCHSDQKK